MRSPTQKIAFTKKILEEMDPPAKGRLTIYDSKTRGLGLRIDDSGRKSFFWRKKIQGRPVFRAIGDFGSTSIEQARGRADEFSGDLDKLKRTDFEGKNPFEQTKTAHTFSEVVSLYIQKRVPHATHPDRAEKAVRWMVDRYLADWKNRKLTTIREKDARDRHVLIAEKHGHTTADRVMQLVRRVLYWSIEKEKIFAGPNPASAVSYFGYKKRKRYLTSDELARLFAALRSEAVSADLRDFVLLSLFCGTRKSDTLAMAWRDLALADNCWRVPEPKGGDPYMLPLVPEAIEILRRREKNAKGAVVYVFPSCGASGHIVEPKRAWHKLLEAAKISDFTIHDLRRTFGSYQAGLGASLVVIGKSLGHKPGSAATSVYAQLDLQPVRASMQAAVSVMLAADKRTKRLKAGTGA